MNAAKRYTYDKRPFKMVKFLSWTSLALILATSLGLSVIIANSARGTLLSKQQDFALLLAENLNHQIFQRFTLPTILRFGRIELQDKEQYTQMDNVVRATIHGQHVLDLRVFDDNSTVSYSMDFSMVGNEDLAGKAVVNALNEGGHSFEIISRVAPLWAMFSFDLAPRSVIMRTTYPLRAERGVYPGDEGGQLMGILEFTQDITTDYKTVINFQWLVIISSFTSSLCLFLLLTMFIRKADTINAQRSEETRALERDLNQAEKLASMGRVVAGIAHEIRNPLGIIQSSAEMLLKKARSDGSDTRAKILGVMHDEIRRLGQTVNEFLDYARPKNPRRDDVDLTQVLDQAMTFLDQECREAGIAVVKHYPSHLRVRGDKDLLYRALYNILVNAMQAIGKDGTLIIEGESSRKELKLIIRDSGPGFTPEVLDKLTDPFFTTKDKGTGLGLALVSNILSSHGAQLIFENAEHGGGQATIVFPKV